MHVLVTHWSYCHEAWPYCHEVWPYCHDVLSDLVANLGHCLGWLV